MIAGHARRAGWRQALGRDLDRVAGRSPSSRPASERAAAPAPPGSGSNCGDLSFRILSRFHTTASAVKSRAVMELHALAQLEDPLASCRRPRPPHSVARPGLMSDGCVGPATGPSSPARRRSCSPEAVALEALVGLAGGQRNVGRCHADAQRALRGSRRGSHHDGAGQKGGAGEGEAIVQRLIGDLQRSRPPLQARSRPTLPAPWIG